VDSGSPARTHSAVQESQKCFSFAVFHPSLQGPAGLFLIKSHPLEACTDTTLVVWTKEDNTRGG
jgi:hypothetical protein